MHAADHLPGWWRSAVIYQVYPRSFRDLNGDGVGDLAGIHGRAALASPNSTSTPSGCPRSTGHPSVTPGYDVSDDRDVDPLFGTLD